MQQHIKGQPYSQQQHDGPSSSTGDASLTEVTAAEEVEEAQFQEALSLSLEQQGGKRAEKRSRKQATEYVDLT